MLSEDSWDDFLEVKLKVKMPRSSREKGLLILPGVAFGEILAEMCLLGAVI